MSKPAFLARSACGVCRLGCHDFSFDRLCLCMTMLLFASSTVPADLCADRHAYSLSAGCNTPTLTRANEPTPTAAGKSKHAAQKALGHRRAQSYDHK